MIQKLIQKYVPKSTPKSLPKCGKTYIFDTCSKSTNFPSAPIVLSSPFRTFSLEFCIFNNGPPRYVNSASTFRHPPTPAGVRRCQTSECRIWPEPELNEPNWIIKVSRLDPRFRQTNLFLLFWYAFCQHPKT